MSPLGRLLKVLAPIISLAVVICAAVWWMARRELAATQRQMRMVTVANDFLRKTLGDLTTAIAARDREIEHLHQSPCGTQESRPPDPRSMPRQRAALPDPDAPGQGSPR